MLYLKSSGMASVSDDHDRHLWAQQSFGGSSFVRRSSKEISSSAVDYCIWNHQPRKSNVMDDSANPRPEGSPATKQPGPLSREQLYELVWKEPMLRVGERFGVSSSYMARVCTELRVPRPPRGYWAQLEFGKAPSQPPLPAARPGDMTEWGPGDFIGITERTAQRQIQSTSSLRVQLAEQDTQTRKARTRRHADVDKLHPLLFGIKQFFLRTRDSESGVVRPFKRLMPDIVSSMEGLDTAIAIADRLFRTLKDGGYRVAIAPTGVQMRRAEVDLREVPRKNHYLQRAWNPERPTVVYVGEVVIGLTLFEMTEQVEMLYVGDSKYLPVRNLTLEQRRRFSGPRYWTTTKDLASGRFCLQAYCPSWLVSWMKRWPEARTGQLLSLVPSIVSELEAAGPELAAKLEEARIRAEEERRRWEEEARLHREEEERALREKRRQQSHQKLLAAISAWDEARRVEAYFAEVEHVATQLGDEERQRLLDRLALAKELIGDSNPLQLLLKWKTPTEQR